MKKFFGMLVVALSLVLVSCGAKDFGEGEFSFTIPGSEFQKMAAARSADSEIQFYFIVIAQIKGSKGFYQKQVLTTSLVNDFEVNPNINIYSTAFKDMSFEFSSIPVNQKYTVMMDVLSRSVYPNANPDPWETWGLPYTAEKSEITVRRNTVTQLEIEFKSVGSIHRPFDIGFNVTYMDGGSEKTKFYTNTELQGIHNINNSDKYDVFPTAHFFQEGEGGNSRLYISDKGRSYPVKSVIAQFAETSHFKQGGEFEMILHDDGTSLGKSSGGKLDFTGKILPNSDGNFIVYPLVIYEGCNIYAQENQFELKIQDFIQTVQYFDLHFVKDAELSYGNARYRATIPLSRLTGLDTVIEGQTFVFYIREFRDGENFTPEFEKLYYKVHKEGWQNLDATAKDLNNICIQVDTENYDYDFIIAANFVSSTDKYLQLFFDLHINNPPSYLDYKAKIDTVSFSKEEHAFAFHKSYYNEAIRYEADIPLNITESLEYKDLLVTLSGTFKLYDLWNSQEKGITSMNFDADFYDGAGYVEQGETQESYYHWLANAERTVNSSSTQMTFYFDLNGANINGEVDNKFHFNCHHAVTDGESSSWFFYIKNYNISTELEDRV